MKTDQASRTADHNALFRALEARRPSSARVVDDPLAVRLLSPEFRVLAEAARVGPVRRGLKVFIDRRWPCARPGVVARTRLIDETIVSALPDVEQVLILGAGFDTRAWRLPFMKDKRVFEVDHPATQATKRQAMMGRDGVRFVPVVFGADDLPGRLGEAGFRSGVRTLVLWEGVTNYLDAETVGATFGFVFDAVASGSPVVFTYVDRRMLDGSVAFDGAETTMAQVRRVGEPFTFGFEPDELPGYMGERGFACEWDTSVADAAARFYPPGEIPLAPAYYHVALAIRV